jgi:hypothetical protein
MRKARLLSTVAATLLLTVGIASAQTMKNDEAPARTPAAQQKAPAEKVAPALKPGEQKASTKKGPETIGQAPKASDADKPKATEKGSMDKGPAVKGSSDANPAVKGSSDANGGANMKPKADENAQAPAGAKSSQSTASEKPATTGQGAAAGSTKLSTEQRSKITTIIRQHKVEPARLNVTVSVGTRVPDSVHFYPLPVEVIVVYPEWRGYDYILVGSEILVIDPRTHEIVAILEA